MLKKTIDSFPYIELEPKKINKELMLQNSEDFFINMNERRSVRNFTNEPFDKKIIENILKTASTAPSGAHKQPWSFCIVSNPTIKKQIRIAAEEEEKLSYCSRMSEEWKKDLAPLGTNWEKPFIEIAPYIIIVFKRSYEFIENKKRQNYYVTESCGIACGFLIAAIHQAGLGCLTHTPSPMNFLTKILNRAENEKPFLLIPVGYIANDCFVPDIERKPLEKVAFWYD